MIGIQVGLEICQDSRWIPPGLGSTRNCGFEWRLAGKKFLVIPPGFLVFLPGIVGFQEDSRRNRWGSVKTSSFVSIFFFYCHLSLTFDLYIYYIPAGRQVFYLI